MSEVDNNVMLKDLLDWDSIMQQPRYAGGHTEVMGHLFRDCVILAKHVQDDYQGTVGYVYMIYFGTNFCEVVIVTDSFGSCGGCDSWEGADDESARNMCIQLANNAHRFKDIDSTVEFLKCCHEDRAAYYDVCSVAPDLLASLEETRTKMRSGDFSAFGPARDL